MGEAERTQEVRGSVWTSPCRIGRVPMGVVRVSETLRNHGNLVLGPGMRTGAFVCWTLKYTDIHGKHVNVGGVLCRTRHTSAGFEFPTATQGSQFTPGSETTNLGSNACLDDREIPSVPTIDHRKQRSQRGKRPYFGAKAE